MQDLKISVITGAYNAQNTIGKCIESVLGQSFKNIQYIIIDGGSTDDTLKIIEKYKNKVDLIMSGPDKGVYDAMNKGIAVATGDIIGTLNADDYYAADDILQQVAAAFSEQNTDIVYGDLDYVDVNANIIRKWRSGMYRRGLFNWGWMPPHPTFYCSKRLFDDLGSYKLNYGSAADYELMLRFIHYNRSNTYYLNAVMVKMVIGGISNKSLKNRIKAICFDFKAMRNNKVLLPLITILLKPLRKIAQFF
jgi:glycosyltransferase involved in cell wall biosynthesis